MEFLIRSEIFPANSSGLLLTKGVQYPLSIRKTCMDMTGLGCPSYSPQGVFDSPYSG